MYCEGFSFYNPKKPVSEKQTSLFRVYEEGLKGSEEEEPRMTDPVQAWEWMLAKARSEWTIGDYNKAIDNTPDGPNKDKLVELIGEYRTDQLDQGKVVGKYREN